MTARRGELIAGASAAALILVMFLFNWYDAGDLGGGEAPKFDAFVAFGFIDFILLVVAISGIVLLALGAARATITGMPVAFSALVTVLGGLAVLLLIFRLISAPGEVLGQEVPDDALDPAIGLFLGLLTSAGIAAGGWLAMQEEGTSFQGEADRVQTDRGTDHRTGPGAGSPPPPPPSGPAA